MSLLLSCKELSKAFGPRKLFENIDFVVHEGDRIGLVGPNGSGKSTLLKILCDKENPDKGQVIRQKNIRLSYLAQDDEFNFDEGVEDNLMAAMANESLTEIEKYTQVHSLLSRAEFVDSTVKVEMLSGGWRKRLAICRALLVDPDILVMDEPTNHLDIEGILWLEKLLAGGATNLSAYILVSHDRRFLENSSNRVIELSAVYPDGLLQVGGNYSKFLEERATFLEGQQVEEDRLANKLKREVDWLRRSPKARTSKSRFRIDEAHKLMGTLAEVKTRNRAEKQVNIDFDSTGRKTKKLLEAKSVSKRYGQQSLFEKLDIILSPGTKLGLLGRNGCGKSTLMKMLAAATGEDRFVPDSGGIVTADKVRIVSFDQNRAGIDPKITLRRALAPDGDAIIFQDRSLHVVSWAKRFLFRTDQLETPVGQLSGGEQARILIADLMRRPADILLLDEPTNDLDIPSLTVLEESLMEFAGALVLVTHDRFLLDKVCDYVLGFGAQSSPVYYASYQQWLEDIEAVEKEKIGKKKEKENLPEQRKKNIGKGRLSYIDQREYDTIEDEIAVAEETVEKLEVEIALPEVVSDAVRIAECWQKLEDAREEVERLYTRWDELEEKKMSEQ